MASGMGVQISPEVGAPGGRTSAAPPERAAPLLHLQKTRVVPLNDVEQRSNMPIKYGFPASMTYTFLPYVSCAECATLPLFRV